MLYWRDQHGKIRASNVGGAALQWVANQADTKKAIEEDNPSLKVCSPVLTIVK